MLERFERPPISEPGLVFPITEPTLPDDEMVLLPFNKSQKDYFHKRDGERCQAKGIIPHTESDKMQIHHVIPQKYAYKVAKIDPDFSNNGILICDHAHRKIHPDMDEFLKTYHTEHPKFDDVQKKRDELLDDKQIYWDDQWDRQLHVRIAQQEQKAEKKGLFFPKKRK